MHLSNHNYIYLALIMMVACMPKEDPIQPYDRGDLQEVFLSSGKDKNTVHFFSMEENKVVASVQPDFWDISFVEGQAYANYHNLMTYASYTGDIMSVTDTVGLHFVSGQSDSLQWELQAETNYIIDFGLDINGKHKGFYRFRYQLNGNLVEMEYADLKSTLLTNQSVDLSSYYSLRTNTAVDLPSRTEYDFSFGKYIHFFEVENLNYEVYGLISPDCKIIVTNADFEGINQSSLDTLSWQVSKWDIIGYDWKFYSLDKGAYEIRSDRNYLIKTQRGFVYKMRFVNFYDNTGQSGHPTFEFKLL